MAEITAKEKNKGKRMRTYESIKLTSVWVIGVSEEEQKKKGTENIFEEIKVKNFLNMGKEIVNQIQEAESNTR